MGFRPIEPTFGVQRDADGAAIVRSAAQPLSGEAAAAPVAAHWGSGETLPATIVSRSSVEPGTGQPTVQLSPLAPAASVPGVAMMGGPASVGALPNEIVFPPRDTGVDGHTSALDAGPVATAAAPWSSVRPPTITSPAPGSTSATGSGSRSAARAQAQPLTLARSVVASPAVAPSQGGGSSGAPVIARIVADPSVPGAPPAVQASTGGGTGGTPVAAITATPVVQRADGAAPPVEGAPQGHSDTELDDLARALFGRIRTHLRAEVIHEREAKGLSFDAF